MPGRSVRRSKKKIEGIAKRLVRDERGLSNVITAIVLVIGGLVLAFAIFGFGAGFLPKGKTPVAQLSFEDYPGALSNGNAFIIKDIGGDAIPLNAMKLVIYNATSKTVVYSNIVADDTGNFSLANTGIYGQQGQALDPGENIIVKSTAINNQPGTYTIQVLYEPTKQAIAEDTITIQ